MKFSELISGSSYGADNVRAGGIDVTGIAYDSRKIKPGNIFFAIKGLKDDGNKFIEPAINKGAKIIFTEEEIPAAADAEIIKVSNIRKLMAELSGKYYFDNSSKLRLIGVTGTNGKTTTSYLIKNFLQDGGYRTGLIGTIDYQIGESKQSSSLTTPDSVELNMMLGEMSKENTDFCVMEVSSIALVMDRVYGLKYDTAVFTNLTSEHLDFHKDMENYFKAKKILFDNLHEKSFAVSNKDDEYGEKILEDTKADKKYYSIKNKSDLQAMKEKLSLNGLEFEAGYRGRTYKFNSGLAGRFNIYNILASVTVALNYNIDTDIIKDSLRNFREVAGRFNRVKLQNGAIAVIDYSHTSDSLKNAIESAREIVTAENRNGRVITIFGCGGNKDRTKRPVMGEFATGLSDYAIITSDNPRFEEPMEIIDEIVKGITGKNNFEILENREEAIKRGIEISREGDIVLICGKGHETYQEIKGIRSHFDDKEIVEKYHAGAA
jgi:UDP-N-acetylmuramoyl-L-alanyl-D-glutamate--2,6-diaminopimelate ligase